MLAAGAVGSGTVLQTERSRVRIKSTWYAAIHDIIPTNERLAAVHLPSTMSCARCGATDTLLHRITKCEEGPVIWTCTRARTAALLPIHPKYISEEWTIRPMSRYWPPQKQAAIVWIMAHLVTYGLQTQRRFSLADYMDFLKRGRWKEYHRSTKPPTVGRYLDVQQCSHLHRMLLSGKEQIRRPTCSLDGRPYSLVKDK